jgi:hypothetical protein
MLLRSIGLSVPHRKHITSQLRAQQVNAIYKFVSMVYQSNNHNYGHYTSVCLLFQRLDSVSRLQVEPTQVGPGKKASLCLRTRLLKKNWLPVLL